MIRPINAADRAVYLEMAHDFYQSDAVDHPVPDSHLERTFDLLIAGSPYAACYLFEEAGTVQGYALLANTWSQEAGGLTVWLEELYVRAPFRGQGLGQAFFAFLKETIHPARFRLETEPHNERAKALYHRQGFVPLDYEPFILDIPG